MTRRYCSIVIALLTYGALRAQTDPQGWLLSLSPQAIWTQPAATAHINTLILNGGYGLGNNRVPLADLIPSQSTLDEAYKSRLLAALDGPVRAGGQGAGNLLAGWGDSARVWHVGVSWQRFAFGRFENPQTAGLLLLGNAAYAGQRISDASVFARQFDAVRLFAGLSSGNETFRWGARLSLWAPQTWTEVNRLEYSLFTAANGDSIQLEAAYQAATGGGFGLSADAGFTWHTGAWTLEGALLGLGGMRVNGEVYAGETNVSFAGVNLGNLFAEEGIRDVFSGLADSLRREAIPSPEQRALWVATPLTFRLAARMAVSARDELSIYAGAQYGGGDRRGVMPGGGGAYLRKWPDMGAQLALHAGWDAAMGWIVGAQAEKRFALGPKQVFVSAGAGNALGWIAPRLGASVSAWAGLAYAW